jgi:hypothetical protein
MEEWGFTTKKEAIKYLSAVNNRVMTVSMMRNTQKPLGVFWKKCPNCGNRLTDILTFHPYIFWNGWGGDKRMDGDLVYYYCRQCRYEYAPAFRYLQSDDPVAVFVSEERLLRFTWDALSLWAAYIVVGMKRDFTDCIEFINGCSEERMNKDRR